MAKKWYIIKHKKKKNWTAYKLEPTLIKSLKKDYEFKGPFKSIVQCMIHANERKES